MFEELGVGFLLAWGGLAVDGLEDFRWEVFGDFCFGAAEHEGFYAHAKALEDGGVCGVVREWLLVVVLEVFSDA